MFLGTTEVVPDFSTVWLFRERLRKSGMYTALWEELQRQIDEKGFEIIEGTIQDASFLTSDPGKKRNKKDLLSISNNISNGEAKTKISDEKVTNEGTWAKKGVKSFFGYKGHILIDTEYHFIRNVATTTASVHDSQIDLGIGGITRYADKGYAGAKTRGYDAAMKKATRGHKLRIREVLRNKRISKKRSHVERCFAVMKRAHK